METPPVSQKPTDSDSAPRELVPVAAMTAHSPRLVECYPEIADDEDERLIYDVRKHWIGIVGILLVSFIVLAVVIGMAAALPGIAKANNATITPTIASALLLFLFVILLLTLLGTGVALWVYTQSRVLITDQNVIEVRQNSLFSRQIAHLNMINVEDVSVSRDGILQTFINYGTLEVQTAAAMDRFQFSYTPQPDVYRRFIIRAHEISIEEAGETGNVLREKIH